MEIDKILLTGKMVHQSHFDGRGVGDHYPLRGTVMSSMHGPICAASRPK